MLRRQLGFAFCCSHQACSVLGFLTSQHKSGIILQVRGIRLLCPLCQQALSSLCHHSHRFLPHRHLQGQPLPRLGRLWLGSPWTPCHTAVSPGPAQTVCPHCSWTPCHTAVSPGAAQTVCPQCSWCQGCLPRAVPGLPGQEEIHLSAYRCAAQA